jgi:hypothetical protein
VNGRRDSGVRTEDGVGQFEEGVAPTVEAFIERAAETVESIGTFHDAPIMHSPTTLRILYLPVELKRKLSSTLLFDRALRIHYSGSGCYYDDRNCRTLGT